MATWFSLTLILSVMDLTCQSGLCASNEFNDPGMVRSNVQANGDFWTTTEIDYFNATDA